MRPVDPVHSLKLQPDFHPGTKIGRETGEESVIGRKSARLLSRIVALMQTLTCNGLRRA